jgi:hypothetical protein
MTAMESSNMTDKTNPPIMGFPPVKPKTIKSLIEPGAERVAIARPSADTWRFRYRTDSYFDGDGNYVPSGDYTIALTTDPAIAAWIEALKGRACADIYAVPAPWAPTETLTVRVTMSYEHAISVSPAPDLGGLADIEDAEDLLQVARALRSFAELTAWPEWAEKVDLSSPWPPGTPPSLGYCRITSAWAVRVLTDLFPEGGWAVDGGHPTIRYWQQAPKQFRPEFIDKDGGMWDRERQAWDGHYWIVGSHEGRAIILDLTADQYGWDPVLIAAGDDPRYRACYSAKTLKDDLAIGKRLIKRFDTWSEK